MPDEVLTVEDIAARMKLAEMAASAMAPADVGTAP